MQFDRDPKRLLPLVKICRVLYPCNLIGIQNLKCCRNSYYMSFGEWSIALTLGGKIHRVSIFILLYLGCNLTGFQNPRLEGKPYNRVLYPCNLIRFQNQGVPQSMHAFCAHAIWWGSKTSKAAGALLHRLWRVVISPHPRQLYPPCKCMYSIISWVQYNSFPKSPSWRQAV